MNLFREISVWERSGSSLIRFRCFEILPTGGYCVQSCDRYSRGRPPQQEAVLERQFIELLLDEAPDERSEVFPTLESAIANHKREFDDSH